ncbi:hypothetical protein [Salinisphaera aquimarina]|uniref:PEP-CTERM protein-sorting domain-containing protein n=1 Tax=Salinisphaera aquimarina TaxID=2094031 RepID=A0ABV7EQ22_9GAMM
MTKSLHTALVLMGLLFVCTTANASLIRFSGSVTGFQTLDGTPTATPVSNFSVGQLFTGTLNVLDAALSPGAIFGNADILDYSFVLGDTQLTNSDSSIAGTVNADGTGLSDFLAFTGLSSLGPDCAFCSSEIRADGFSIQSYTGGGNVVGDLTARIEAGVTDVPAPGGIGFAGFALIGLVALRRRMGG